MWITSARGKLASGLLAGAALCMALAPDPSRAGPADQAKEAVGLFVQSCLKHVEDPEDLRAWIAATPQLRQLSDRQAQEFLEGKRGQVWSASNDAGLFALALFNDNTCTVLAQQASADQVSLVFSEYVRRKGLPLNKIGDRKEFIRGIDQREETYRSHSGMQYEVVVVTSKSLRAEVQAILTTHPNR
jgi:hypothetical protein